MRACFPVFALLMLGLAGYASEGEEPSITVVRTWGELARQPGIALPDGCVAHIGIESVDGPAFPGVVLYCLVDGQAPTDEGGRGRTLGPMTVRNRANELIICKLQATSLLGERWNLYAASVDLVVGDNDLEVRLGDRLVGRVPVTGNDTPIPAWGAVEVGPRVPHEALEPRTIGQPISVVITAPRRIPALPAIDGTMPWSVAAIDPMRRLPTALPQDIVSLELAVTRDAHNRIAMLITAPSRVLTHEAIDHLLLRWWIDGHEVANPANQPDELRSDSLGGSSDQIQVVLDHADLDRLAAPGARIEVQTAWCLDGLHKPHSLRMIMQHQPQHPDTERVLVSARVAVPQRAR